MLGAAACVVAGLLILWGGWALQKKCEGRPGETRFVRVWSPVVLGTILAYLLMFLGLFLIAILAPMAWIAHR